MAKILAVDDEPQILMSVKRVLKKDHEITTAGTGEAALKKAQDCSFDAALLDFNLPGIDGITVLERLLEKEPDLPVIMLTGIEDIDVAVRAMKAGAFDYISKPAKPEELRLVVERGLEKRGLKQELVRLRAEVSRLSGMKSIVGKHPAMVELFEQIQLLAPRKTTVLIIGESGTGKELAARAIHQLGPLDKKPFVAVNCAAIPEGLMEDEFFGHEKGAFTDAKTARMGKMEKANHGTLFLDEIGELSPSGQAKLLRVLQERQFTRVGGTEVVNVDIRIIAATNVDLRKSMEEGNFREDLFYRIHVVPLQLPPLRQRCSDIPLLLSHFIKKIAKREDIPIKSISPEAMDALMAYNWPGNVRELENTAERLMAVTVGNEIHRKHLTANITGGSSMKWPEREAVLSGQISLTDAVETFEKETIKEALNRCMGSKTNAAKLLGISSRMIRYKLSEKDK